MFVLDGMINKNNTLVNDLKVVMNKMNDHNNTTVDIFSSFKTQVHFHK